MNKLTKLMLASAVLATSGFAASDVVVTDGGTVNAYNDTIDVSVTVGCGGSIAVQGDVTLQNKLVLEAGSKGTIAEGKTLTNENEIVMTWDACAPGVFARCGGRILQTKTVVPTQCSINHDVDGSGAKTWYVYTGMIDVECYGAKTFYILNKNCGKNAYDVCGGWYRMGYMDGPSCYETIGEMICEGIDHSLPITGGMVCGGMVTKIMVDAEKTSVLNLNGIETIAFYTSDFTGLACDTTNLNGTDLAPKSAKKLETIGGGFSPNIPSVVAPIMIEDPCCAGQFLTFGANMGSVSNADTLKGYFASFGISFKQTGGTADSEVNYGEGRTAIQALDEATSADAVLIDNNGIAVGGSDVTVETNLHNIGVTCAAPSFTGNGMLTLTGDNRLLKNATFANPTTISGTNSLPTNAVFNGDLTINNSVSVECGNSVTVNGGFSVAGGKSVSVAGVLNLGSAPTNE